MREVHNKPIGLRIFFRNGSYKKEKSISLWFLLERKENFILKELFELYLRTRTKSLQLKTFNIPK